MQHKARKFSTRAKAVTSAAAVAAVGAGVFGAVSASADTQSAPAVAPVALKAKTTTTSNHLTLVAVVDRNGNTVVTLRGDGAGPQSYESAIRKAYTSVSWNAPTSELAERLKNAPNLKDIPNTLFLAGGTPVVYGKAPIAGIGVAGAPSGDLDEKYARAGVAALADGR
jgi:uncharacterized protein GlcG (DUF336 family)